MEKVDKILLTNLKRQKTILLNKSCKTMQDFEETQDKLNKIEFQIQMINKEEN